MSQILFYYGTHNKICLKICLPFFFCLLAPSSLTITQSSNVLIYRWTFLLSKEDVMWCMVRSSCDSHEWPLLKPCWKGVRKLWFLRWIRMWLQIICSRILQQTLVSDTGLKLAGSCLFPFLKTGLTLALTPVLRKIYQTWEIG